MAQGAIRAHVAATLRSVSTEAPPSEYNSMKVIRTARVGVTMVKGEHAAVVRAVTAHRAASERAGARLGIRVDLRRISSAQSRTSVGSAAESGAASRASAARWTLSASGVVVDRSA